MRTKALITSIVLSLTVVALIGHFVVGCSGLKDAAVRPSEDQSVAYAEVRDQEDKSALRPEVAAQPEKSKDALYIQNALSEQEVAKNEDNRPDEVLLKNDTSPIPYAQEPTYPRNWRGVVHESKRAANGVVRTPGGGMMGGGQRSPVLGDADADGDGIGG